METESTNVIVKVCIFSYEIKAITVVPKANPKV